MAALRTPTRADVLVAVVAVLVVEAEARAGPLASNVLALGFAALALRRRRPVLVLELLVVVCVVDALLGGVLVSVLLTPMLGVALAAYAVGAQVTPRLASPACALAVVGLTVADQVGAPGAFAALNDAVFYMIVIGAPALAGAILGARVREVRELRALTEQLALQREVEIRAVQVEEQTRVERGAQAAIIQRMGGIALQAAGAERSGATHPEETLDALGRIEGTAREGLEQLRDLLGTLRHVSRPAAPGPLPSPEPPPAATVPRGIGVPDLLAACSGVLVAVEAATSDSLRGPVVANVVAGLLLGLPLLVRRRHPTAAWSAMLAVGVAMSGWLTPVPQLLTSLVPFMLAAYSVAARMRGRLRVLGLSTLPLGVGVIELATPAVDRDPTGMAPSLGFLVAAAVAGLVAADREDRAAELASVAARIDAGRDAELRLAGAERRALLARELHDVVAHALTVVCLHAGAAQRMWADDPGESLEALRTVARVSREATAELRVALDVLDAAPVDAGRLDVALLVARAREAGLTVEVATSGRARAIDPGVLRVAQRVLQEALTNAARHAPGASVQVRLAYEEAWLGIEVTDRGAAVVPVGGAEVGLLGSRSGLAGMRDRVAAQGGDVEYGPRDEGFRVSARLPAQAQAPAEVDRP